MKRILLLALLALCVAATPAFAFHDIAQSSDLIRLWKAGWKADELLDLVEEKHLWIDLSASDVADMAEAGIPRETITELTKAIEANEPRRERATRSSRTVRRPVDRTYGYYDPWYRPRSRWSAHVDLGHFGFGHGGGHFGGGHHGGGHHGGHH